MREKYRFLEGIRGLASTYVVFFHIYQACTYKSESSQFVQILLGWACAGVPAVATFIVLSGVLLTLPVVLTGNIPGGIRGFAIRRSKRILPPYLVSLLVSAVIMTLVLPGLFNDPTTYVFHTWAKNPIPNLIAHLALVHNLMGFSCYSFNGPLWSVATECQIYFLFAILLVPCRKRFGIVSYIIIGNFLAIVAMFFPVSWSMRAGCLWLVGCFVMGSAVVEIAEGVKCRGLFLNGPWKALTAISSLGLIAWIGFSLSGNSWAAQWLWSVPVSEYLTAFATGCCILLCLRGDPIGHLINRLLNLNWIRFLGKRSYSLYLTHGPIIGGLDSHFRHNGLNPDTRAILLVTIGVPICLISPFVFLHFVERHTISKAA